MMRPKCYSHKMTTQDQQNVSRELLLLCALGKSFPASTGSESRTLESALGSCTGGTKGGPLWHYHATRLVISSDFV